MQIYHVSSFCHVFLPVKVQINARLRFLIGNLSVHQLSCVFITGHCRRQGSLVDQIYSNVEVHDNSKMTVLVVKYFTCLKHTGDTALDRLRVRLNVILLSQ